MLVHGHRGIDSGCRLFAPIAIGSVNACNATLRAERVVGEFPLACKRTWRIIDEIRTALLHDCFDDCLWHPPRIAHSGSLAVASVTASRGHACKASRTV